jgi:hypothetical protein
MLLRKPIDLLSLLKKECSIDQIIRLNDEEKTVLFVL